MQNLIVDFGITLNTVRLKVFRAGRNPVSVPGYYSKGISTQIMSSSEKELIPSPDIFNRQDFV